MEKRAPSHTEEEEMNQRRRLLHLARKGDPKAIGKLFELYQVRVFSGDNLRKAGKLPIWPGVAAANAKAAKKREAEKALAKGKSAPGGKRAVAQANKKAPSAGKTHPKPSHKKKPAKAH